MKKIICLILLGLLSAKLAMAAGISVNPSELNFQLEVKQHQLQKLTIKNITGSPLVYSFYPDELSDQIIIQPKTVRLEPDQNQEIQVIVSPKHTGTYLTNLSILAQALDKKEFNAVAGVKVPLEIVALPVSGISFYKTFLWYMIILLLVIIGLMLVINYRRRRKPLWQRLTESMDLLHKPKPWWKKIISK